MEAAAESGDDDAAQADDEGGDEPEWDESPLMALKKAELLETAEGLGVEVDSKMTKQQIADAVLAHIG